MILYSNFSFCLLEQYALRYKKYDVGHYPDQLQQRTMANIRFELPTYSYLLLFLLVSLELLTNPKIISKPRITPIHNGVGAYQEISHVAPEARPNPQFFQLSGLKMRKNWVKTNNNKSKRYIVNSTVFEAKLSG